MVGGRTRANALSRHTRHGSPALPLASVFNSFAVAHACVLAPLSVVSPPWGHRRSRCDEKRGAAAAPGRWGGARASSSCSPLVGATLLLVMGRPCRSNRSECVCALGARWRSYVRGGSIVPCGTSPRLAVGVWWCRLHSFVCAHVRTAPACHRRSSVVVAWACASSHVRANACRSLVLVSSSASGLSRRAARCRACCVVVGFI